MREAYRVGGRWPKSVLRVILLTMVALFICDRVSQAFRSEFLASELSLSVEGLKSGKLWQLVTYMFMHDGLFHILCNGLVLFFMGRFVEQRYGGGRLLSIFIFSGIIGAIAWICLHFNQHYAVLLGASAGCLGVFSYFCLTCENRPLTFLLFFIIPINMKPRVLLAITTGLEFYSFLSQELMGGRTANSAHLGGLVGGCVCYFFFKDRRKVIDFLKNKLTCNRRSASAMSGDSYKIYIASYSEQRREIDRILDKINKEGFHSLTQIEKETLNAAKHLMHR